ncbi:MAG: hypothetical protein K5869_06710 [Saccharofermentans sp.]|nr:hypothetical protein [Saccharofermentans sp.]
MQGSIQILSALNDLKRELEWQLYKINERIEDAPEGYLRISKTRNKYQFYLRTDTGDTRGKYIPYKEKNTAVQLAQKDYDLRLRAVLEEQLKEVDRFLKHYEPDAAVKVYEDLSEARRLLVTPEYLTDDEYVRKWLDTPYQKLGFRSDDPEYFTENNERVRSKSEIIIANTLRSHNIPYRYEFPVYEDGVVIAAPDFNCLNVRTRKEYYWEHLGMMGDDAYVNKNIRKIERYTLAKHFDESRLILTFETDKHPLNTRIIEEKIRRYLL